MHPTNETELARIKEELRQGKYVFSSTIIPAKGLSLKWKPVTFTVPSGPIEYELVPIPLIGQIDEPDTPTIVEGE